MLPASTVQPRFGSPRQEVTLTSTLELGDVNATESFPVHAFGSLAARAARLDRMLEQVLGQPAQVAVADERITSQVPARMTQKSRKCDVMASWTLKHVTGAVRRRKKGRFP